MKNVLVNCVWAGLVVLMTMIIGSAAVAYADEAEAGAEGAATATETVAEDTAAATQAETGTEAVVAEQQEVDPQYSSIAVKRIGGTDRYGTAKKVVTYGWDGEVCTGVIVTTGTIFPDTLAASGYAGLSEYPIMITPTGEGLGDDAKTLLKTMKGSQSTLKITIIGGTSAVSSQAEHDLALLAGGTGNINRIWGADRFETAEQVYMAGSGVHTWGNTAVICTGVTFADALSISPFAYRAACPMFFTQQDSNVLKKSSLACLKDLFDRGVMTRVVFVGNNSAVDDSVKQQIINATGMLDTGSNYIRLGGDNRYETNSLVAQWEGTQGLSYNYVGVATGVQPPDALAGGALQGHNSGILLLVNDQNYLQSAQIIGLHRDEIQEMRIYGGRSAVSNQISSVLTSSLNPISFTEQEL